MTRTHDTHTCLKLKIIFGDHDYIVLNFLELLPPNLLLITVSPKTFWICHCKELLLIFEE